MCRLCQGIAGLVLLAAVAACSDTGTQQGQVPFKGTPTEPLNALSNQMKKNAQAQAQKEREQAKAKESKPEEPSKAKETKTEGPSKAKETKPADTKTPGKTG